MDKVEREARRRRSHSPYMKKNRDIVEGEEIGTFQQGSHQPTWRFSSSMETMTHMCT